MQTKVNCTLQTLCYHFHHSELTINRVTRMTCRVSRVGNQSFGSNKRQKTLDIFYSLTLMEADGKISV